MESFTISKNNKIFEIHPYKNLIQFSIENENNGNMETVELTFNEVQNVIDYLKETINIELHLK